MKVDLPTLSLLIFVFCVCINAQTAPQAATRPAAKIDGEPPLASTPPPNDRESKLVDGSRAEIIRSGITAPYFDQHFKLISVTDRPGDRRAAWQYSVDGYTTIVVDTIGFYTGKDGQQVNVHSIGNTFQSAHEITKTIIITEARRLMQACLGKYIDETVAYNASVAGTSGLFLTAVTAFRTPKPGKVSEREERERRAAKKGRSTVSDIPEEEDEKGSGHPIYLGFINLETGRCSKTRVKMGPGEK